MIVRLLTEHHLEFLCLKGGCRGSSESTLDKMSNCWKSHAVAQLCYQAFVDYWLQPSGRCTLAFGTRGMVHLWLSFMNRLNKIGSFQRIRFSDLFNYADCTM